MLDLFDEIYPNVIFSVPVLKIECDEIDGFEYGSSIEFMHYVRLGATGNEKAEWEPESCCCCGKGVEDVALDSGIFALVQTIDHHKARSHPIEGHSKEETPGNPTRNNARPGTEGSGDELFHGRLDGSVKEEWIILDTFSNSISCFWV